MPKENGTQKGQLPKIEIICIGQRLTCGRKKAIPETVVDLLIFPYLPPVRHTNDPICSFYVIV